MFIQQNQRNRLRQWTPTKALGYSAPVARISFLRFPLMRHQGLPWYSRTAHSKIQAFLNNSFYFYEMHVDGFSLQLESFRTNQTKSARDEGLLSPELCPLALTYPHRSKFYALLLTSRSSTRKASPLPPWTVISYLCIRSSIINSFKFDSKGSLGLRIHE